MVFFFCHHLHDELKNEYLTEKDPLTLCNKLRERDKHQKIVMLLKAHYGWMHLKLHSLKSVHN